MNLSNKSRPCWKSSMTQNSAPECQARGRAAPPAMQVRTRRTQAVRGGAGAPSAALGRTAAPAARIAIFTPTPEASRATVACARRLGLVAALPPRTARRAGGASAPARSPVGTRAPGRKGIVRAANGPAAVGRTRSGRSSGGHARFAKRT